MAKKFLVSLDLNRNELQNAVLQNLSVAPENAKNGQLYYNTETNKVCFFENGAFVSFANAAEMATALAGKVDVSVYEAKIAEIEAALALKANAADVYTKEETYTKEEIDAAIAEKDSLPEQANHAGEFLTTNGTEAAWSALPIASAEKAGIVKAGENVTIAEDGTINAHGAVASVNGQTGEVVVSEILDSNTQTSMIKVWVGTKEEYDAIAEKDENTLYYIQKDGEAIDVYELLEKKQDKLTAGTNIELVTDEEGNVILNNTYVLPTASAEVLGGIKVGSNLSIDENGVLSAAGAVASVNGQTGVIVLDKASVGLDQVDNTSDADKPISTATQAALDEKADKATTLAGYGITDAYTKEEVEARISSVYRFKGTVADVDALPTEGNVEGDVYNVTSTGDNYAWVAGGEGEEGFWDKLAGEIDLTAYITAEQIAATYLTQTDAASTYLAQTDAAATYATKEELASVNSGAVHKQVFVNEALTPEGGVATWTIAHEMGDDVEVTIKEVATGDEVFADVAQSTNSVVVRFNASSEVLAGTYKVVVLG